MLIQWLPTLYKLSHALEHDQFSIAVLCIAMWYPLILPCRVTSSLSSTTTASSTILYGGKLWCCKNLAKLTTDQKFIKFSPSKFLHIYSKVSRECNTATCFKNIEEIEDIFVHTHPTTCRVPLIVFLIATACRSCEFLVSHSQSKPPSAKGLSLIDW